MKSLRGGGVINPKFLVGFIGKEYIFWLYFYKAEGQKLNFKQILKALLVDIISLDLGF